MTGPLLDLRMQIGRGFYYRELVGVFFYRDVLQFPTTRRVGSEATFGILYVFHEQQH